MGTVVLVPAAGSNDSDANETAVIAKNEKRFEFGDAPDKRNAAPGNFPSLKKSDGPRFRS